MVVDKTKLGTTDISRMIDEEAGVVIYLRRTWTDDRYKTDMTAVPLENTALESDTDGLDQGGDIDIDEELDIEKELDKFRD